MELSRTKRRFLLLAILASPGCDRGWGDLALRSRGICTETLNKSLVMLPRIDRVAFLARCEQGVAPSLRKCASETTFPTDAAIQCIAMEAQPIANALIEEERNRAPP